MNQSVRALGVLALLGSAIGCGDNNGGDINAPPVGPIATSITATGDISAKVGEYRTLLGDPRNGGTVGPQASGRREITWDGVPAQFDNGDNLFPGDFFKNLGVVFTTTGTGFRNDSTLFTGVNPAYADQFAFFSANKIFAPVGSNILDVTFQVPGSHDSGPFERVRCRVLRCRHARSDSSRLLRQGRTTAGALRCARPERCERAIVRRDQV